MRAELEIGPESQKSMADYLRRAHRRKLDKVLLYVSEDEAYLKADGMKKLNLYIAR